MDSRRSCGGETARRWKKRRRTNSRRQERGLERRSSRVVFTLQLKTSSLLRRDANPAQVSQEWITSTSVMACWGASAQLERKVWPHIQHMCRMSVQEVVTSVPQSDSDQNTLLKNYTVRRKSHSEADGVLKLPQPNIMETQQKLP